MEIKIVLLNILIFFSSLFLLSPSVSDRSNYCIEVFINVSDSVTDYYPIQEAKDENSCVYNIYIKTGSIIKGGTDSKITLELYTKSGDGVRITDIESWGGLMGLNYDYFERGNVDVFSGRGPCLSGPVCSIKVISDGSGPHHGWYCDYVDVTTTGPHLGCAKLKFDVNQWLGTDVSPYELTAVWNSCAYDELSLKDGNVKVVHNLRSFLSV